MSGREHKIAFEVLSEQLKQAACEVNELFSQYPPRRWRACLQQELSRLLRFIGGNDLLLLRIASRKNSDCFVKVLGRAAVQEKSNQRSTDQFAFRLLPQEIQDGLKSGTTIRVVLSNGAGGRMLQELQNQTISAYAVLVPVFRRDKQLAGAMVCLSDDDHCGHLEDDQIARLSDLVRLLGSLLLTNVMRLRKLAKRNRELNQWKKIADNACDFALQIDARLNISKVIPFGVEKEAPEIAGLRLTDVVERTFHLRLRQQFSRVKSDQETRTIEFRITLGAQQSTWYHARIEPDPANGGSLMMYLTDNNRDKRLQSEINLLNEQLVRASRLSVLGQMSTEFAHQLNQPLQAILGYCNLVQNRRAMGRATEENTDRSLDQIDTAVTHAIDIVGSIRDFARYRALNIREVRLSEILEHAIMMVAEKASQLRGEFQVPDIPDDVLVMADKPQTTHVLINLFVNALEATSEFGVSHPLIVVTMQEGDEPNRVVVAVKDNGPGISGEPEAIFEKFHTNKEDGLGLGLAISREVCESQQGSLTVTNNDGEAGCTFLITLRTPSDSETDSDERPEDSIQLSESAASTDSEITPLEIAGDEDDEDDEDATVDERDI